MNAYELMMALKGAREKGREASRNTSGLSSDALNWAIPYDSLAIPVGRGYRIEKRSKLIEEALDAVFPGSWFWWSRTSRSPARYILSFGEEGTLAVRAAQNFLAEQGIEVDAITVSAELSTYVFLGA